MRVSVLLLLAASISSVARAIKCITIASTALGLGNDGTVSVGCDDYWKTVGFTAVSCGVRAMGIAFGDVGEVNEGTDGVYMNNNGECVAVNAYKGLGVYAVAQCCDFAPILGKTPQCIGYSDGKKISGDDNVHTARCDQNSKYSFLTGCAPRSDRNGDDGAWYGSSGIGINNMKNGKGYAPFGYSNECTIMSGSGNHEVWAQLVCCDAALQDVLECRQTHSPTSLKRPDYDVAAQSCGSHESVMGCTGYGKWRNVESWFPGRPEHTNGVKFPSYVNYGSGPGCVALNDGTGEFVQTSGLCCSEKGSSAMGVPVNLPVNMSQNVPVDALGDVSVVEVRIPKTFTIALCVAAVLVLAVGNVCCCWMRMRNSQSVKYSGVDVESSNEDDAL